MDSLKSIKNLRLDVSLWAWFWLFLTPAFFLFLPFYLFYIQAYSKQIRRQDGDHYLIYLTVFCCFCLSIYGFSKIKKFFKLEPVLSDLHIETKNEIVWKIKEVLRLTGSRQDELNSFIFIYRNPKWYKAKIMVTVTILIDENGFYVNVTDTGACFPFDFGYYKSFETRVINAILTELTPH